MKTKLLTLVLFASLTFGFLGCTEEEVTPSQEPSNIESGHGAEREGALIDR